MILESFIMDFEEVGDNRLSLCFVMEDDDERVSIEKVLMDMGWVHFNVLVNKNLYIKGKKRIMFIDPIFYEHNRFCGLQLYGIVVTNKSLQHLDVMDLMWLRTRVRNYGQYSYTHIAGNYRGYWEVQGF